MRDKMDHIEHLRIYAISSVQILSLVKSHAFKIERCSILLRAFAPDDPVDSDFLSQIKLAVTDWRALERERRIGKLIVRTYDFQPTE